MTSLISSLFAASSTELTSGTAVDTVINEVKTELKKLVRIRAAMHQAPPASRILNDAGALNPA